MFKKLRKALSTTAGKLKAVILVSGLVIILSVIMVGALQLTSTPTFCKSCHEMNPEYYTWQNSDHNQIACVKCHIKPGVVNFVEHKVNSLKEVYAHFTGSYVTPIELTETLDNSICMQCHDMSKRVVTPSGDIKFPHNKHLAQGVSCITCHSGVVHGSIEEKGFTSMTNFDSWNAATGKVYVNSAESSYFTKLQMKDCISCHTDRNVPVSCDTCHTKITKPASHGASTWLTSHGAEANQDFVACDKCHSVTSQYQGVIPLGTTVATYARTNTFCNNCHKNKPDGHSAAWRRDHSVPAKINRSLCLVCHDESRTGTSYIAPSKVTCQDCHSGQHEIPTTHPIPIPASGYGEVCIGCHDQSRCEKCHAPAGSK